MSTPTRPDELNHPGAVIRELQSELAALREKLTELKGWETTTKLLHEEECKSLRADNERLKKELAIAETVLEHVMRIHKTTSDSRFDHAKNAATANATIAQLRQQLAAAQESLHLANGTADLALKHRDEAERREAVLRGALQRIYDDTEGYADGAPDASEHDYMCNKISGMAHAALTSADSELLEAINGARDAFNYILNIMAYKLLSDDSTIDAGSTAFTAICRWAEEGVAKLAAFVGDGKEAQP